MAWFLSDSHGDHEASLFPGPPPRIAKVRAIAATARVLRPTKSSLARTTEQRQEKAQTKQGRRRPQLSDNDDDDDEDDDKENGRHPNARGRRNQKQQRQVRKRRLTIPQSPKFHPHPRKQPREPLLTMTSRELREIEALRKKVRETRKRHRQYHEATTRGVRSFTSSAGGDKQTFTLALQSCGVVGVPAVRRPKLTTPVGFNFEVDKRANAKKRTRSDLETTTSVAANTRSQRRRL